MIARAHFIILNWSPHIILFLLISQHIHLYLSVKPTSTFAIPTWNYLWTIDDGGIEDDDDNVADDEDDDYDKWWRMTIIFNDDYNDDGDRTSPMECPASGTRTNSLWGNAWKS